MDELLLGSQIKDGNKEAFRQLYDLYSKKIYGFALYYLKSVPEAEEVIQAVFVKLWEGRNEIRENLSLRSFLYKITLNHIYNYLKHKNVQKSAGAIFQLAEDTDNSTQEHIFYNNLKEHIDLLIEQLPEQRRTAFKLSRMEGLTHEEIAKRMQISVRTVESQVYKAIKFLRKHLKGELILFYFMLF